MGKEQYLRGAQWFIVSGMEWNDVKSGHKNGPF
jgi:hypothetical protein